MNTTQRQYAHPEYRRWRTGYFGMVFLVVTAQLHAHVFCVPSAAYPNLQSALDAAGLNGAFNGEDNTIKIARGTYTVSAAMTYVSEVSHSLEIYGGYSNTGGCTTHNSDPRQTVFDGGGTVRILESETSAGSVTIKYLTFQNGSTSHDGGALLMNDTFNTSGDVIVSHDIFRNNTAGSGSGGAMAVVATGSATMHVDNNLIVGNRATNNSGALEFVSHGASAYFINNTVVQNVVMTSPDGNAGGMKVSGTVAGVFSNNIFWGNTGYDLALELTATMVENDYKSTGLVGSVAAGSFGDQHVDPLFVSSTDFHLGGGSPLLGDGETTPVGGLSVLDLDGNSRKYNAVTDTVDLGAYEHGDEIFNDGYDN